MRIYLDVCCLNRPFDDQTQDRIHLESEAVVIILKNVRAGSWKWITSEVVSYEISQTPNIDRRQRVESLIRYADRHIMLDTKIVKRGSKIEKIGFGAYDALHLACAEHSNADIFLTTDDKLLQMAGKKAAQLQVKVDNPLSWLKGMI